MFENPDHLNTESLMFVEANGAEIISPNICLYLSCWNHKCNSQDKKNVFSFFSASHLNTGFIKHQCLFSKMLSCDTHVGDAILNSAHVIS